MAVFELEWAYNSVFLRPCPPCLTGCYGYGDGLFGGQSIGFPPLLKFGSDELVDRIAPGILLGEKRICLAVTEPYAGSDVAKIRTRGVRRAQGGWSVTGVKKWITGGMFSEYFTTIVATDEVQIQIYGVIIPRYSCSGKSF